MELVPIFEAWGFAWGRWFGRHPSGMHFEVAVPHLVEPLRPRLVINDVLIEGVRLELRNGTKRGVLGPIAAVIGDRANKKSRVMMPIVEYLRSHGYKVRWDPRTGPRGTVIATC